LQELSGKVAGIKLGIAAYTALGPALLEKAREHRLPVFLDLKFHDIPSIVKQAAQALAQLGIWMFTAHTSGGAEMLAACREGLESSPSSRPLLLGVTVLTSQKSGEDEVVSRARLARESGCDGVVASAHEVARLRKEFGRDFLLVTPGLRFSGPRAADDQERVATPEEALRAGSDFLVLGRPLLASLLPWVRQNLSKKK
jgi:orotidine-5'-phosphate decarboxylase